MCGVTALFELFVNCFDVVVTLGIGEDGWFHDQRLEANEDLPGHDLKTAATFVTGVDNGVRAIGDGLDSGESLCSDEPRRIETKTPQVLFGFVECGDQRG